jgi:hypothetical protein
MATQKFEDTYEFPDEKAEKAAAEEKFEVEIETTLQRKIVVASP